MKKGFLIASMLLLLMVSVFIGCSDDDEKTITSAAAAQGYLIGYVNIDGTDIDFYSDIMPMTNNGFSIDSIVANDTIAEYRDDSYWNVYGDDNYHWAEIYNSPTTFTSGDTAEVKFYRNNSMTSFKIRLMDSDTYVNYILPVANDTVSLGSPINVLFNSNQDAEWYGVRYYGYRDSAGTQVYFQKVFATTDTTFTIPASFNIYNGYYWMNVAAVNGPGQGDPVNLNGAGLIGEFHSYTYSQSRRVYIGTGDPSPVSNNPVEPELDPKEASRIMMNHFTGHELRKDNH